MPLHARTTCAARSAHPSPQGEHIYRALICLFSTYFTARHGTARLQSTWNYCITSCKCRAFPCVIKIRGETQDELWAHVREGPLIFNRLMSNNEESPNPLWTTSLESGGTNCFLSTTVNHRWIFFYFWVFLVRWPTRSACIPLHKYYFTLIQRVHNLIPLKTVFKNQAKIVGIILFFFTQFLLFFFL